MRIVLASASPRRQELLRNAGIDFEVQPANIEEVRLTGETATEFGERMAHEKARAVRKSRPEEWILAADTVVVVADEALGKPTDENDASRMLRLVAGREHQVITGVCLLSADFEDVRSESTAVHFSPMTDAEIQDYVATGEPMDKAGAYAIQGIASRWISKVEGDYSNVVGLPVDLVWRMLREHGA
jgi:septum formation protein